MSPQQRYVSRELTHFLGKDFEPENQYNLLVEVLRSGWLTHPPHEQTTAKRGVTINRMARISDNEMYVPNVVCFCDIPLDDLRIHMNKYGCFAFSFLKSFLVAKGANPVFYLAKNSSVPGLDLSDPKNRQNFVHRVPAIEAGESVDLYATTRAEHFDRMIREYDDVFRMAKDPFFDERSPVEVPELNRRLVDVEMFLTGDVFSLLKCFDDTKPDDDPTNYYMEREWRILGNLQFGIEDVWRVILPASFALRFRNDFPQYVGQLAFAE